MRIGVPSETYPGERRVALIPADLPRLTRAGHEVIIQAGAGAAAGYPDDEYTHKGASVAPSRAEVFAKADFLVGVRGLGANPEAGQADLASLRKGQALFAFLDPLGQPALAKRLAETGVTAFAVELVPRITRAQSMDALSSMANIAGYRAVLIAATHMPKLLPMMMTAAGTISPAKFFVLGVGVAGLQAIATARRLGASVEAYDIRPEVKDQVISVGGTFVELDLETEGAGDSGGYAKAQSDDFYKKQQEQLAAHIRHADAVITTAAVPGRRAPILVTKAMMNGMHPGSVIVDLAAETGGNCEGTVAGETVERDGVQIIGPRNIPSDLPYHASQMYSRNVITFIAHVTGEGGALVVDTEDQITNDTLVAKDGDLHNPRVREALEKSA